jgi:hypothetical protein
MRGCSNSGGDVVSRCRARLERGAVVQRARELVEFARRQGYRVEELVEIIEDLA